MTARLILPDEMSTDFRARRLFRARLAAVLALLIAASLFVAAHVLPLPAFWRGVIGAAGEAGMIGGLADWFAITALFRRPLGLPIPHTALIPTRKDEIARSLSRFVEDYFLDPPLLVARLKEEDRAAQLGAWLATPHAAQFVALRITELLRELVRRGAHLNVVDVVLPLLRRVNANLRETVIAQVGRRTGPFVPRFVDRKLAKTGGKVLDGIIEALGDPGSNERAAFDGWLRARFDEIPKDLQEAASALWSELKDNAVRSESSPELVAAITGLVQQIGRAIVASPETRLWINGVLERALIDYIVPWRRQIGHYIEGVVRRWDAKKVTDVIELQVGRDLQFIRLNGTLIGALIGVVLFLGSWFTAAL